MKAVEISTFGPPDVLRLTDRPRPQPAAGEVLIDVVAAGVNRPDLMQRQGHYPPPPGVTDIPGLEVAGIISAVGAANDDGLPASASGHVWSVGEAVTALVAGGGYAEQCVAPGVQCLPVPAGLDLVAAAALPETVFTVWTNVFDRGHLVAGEWLLVHGGTSGIGSTAIQLAAARGAHVIATAGTDEKCRACERLGARLAVNYREQDFVAAVAGVTGGRGVDVVLDIVGAPYLARNLDALALEGRLVQVGVMGGATADLTLSTLLRKRLTITASTLRVRSPREKGAIAAAVEASVWPLIASGRVRPAVHATLPLAEAAEAHARLERGEIIGKVVLRVASPQVP